MTGTGTAAPHTGHGTPDHPAPARQHEPTAAPTTARATTPSGRSRGRRQEILEGSAEMFAELGYHGASLRDIAKHVGISHPGMLHHFHTKEALLGHVIDGLEARAQRYLEDVGDGDKDPEALIGRLLAQYDPSALPVRLQAVLASETVSADHPGRYRIARLRRVHEFVLERFFDRMAATGKLREDVDPAFASRAVMSLVLSHAGREATVRAMQNAGHGDEPVSDLNTLIHLFLVPAA